MNIIKYYIVDAFADRLFTGNQAGVCVLNQELEDEVMQNIAAENNLSETAFVIKRNIQNEYGLRWFTPKSEVDLCGHATLGTAFIISKFVDKDVETMIFHTKSAGVLTVTKKEELFQMSFPSRKPKKIDIEPIMREVINIDISEALASRDLVLVLNSEKQIKELKPDINKMMLVPDYMGIIVTAKGDNVDFVSRFFAPKVGVPEDPVTGSAHSTLIPFWSERLGKKQMTAQQLSERGGTLFCEFLGDRVLISGYVKLYLEGNICIQN